MEYLNDPDENDEGLEVPLSEFPMEEVIEQADGSVIVPMEDTQQPQQFDDNLAETLDIRELSELATELLDLVNADKESRQKRDDQYEEGLRRTGMGDDAPGGAKFTGASKAVHPVLAEACVDFASRAIKEIFPANGPVKIESEGVLTPQEEQIAKAVRRCLNDQFLHRIKEYRDVTEEKLTQLPLGGSQYTKFYFDITKRRVCVEFVPIDDVFIPFYASSFYEAERQTVREKLTQEQLEKRIKSGEYRDYKMIQAAMEPESSSTEIANQKIEGKTPSGKNEDGTRNVYEIYCWLELEQDQYTQGQRAPYIVAVDEIDQEILKIRRNWDPNDQLFEKLDWIVEDKFIPWRGAYGIGLPHLIGGLAGAATGALRALLDSAHINNAPTLLKLKGSRISGQSQNINVTQLAEIEGPTGIDDIRKYLMPLPFNPPSPVLFQLLGWLTEAAKGVVSTASEKIGEATSNTPVGTAQALIEQGAIIFSSIHARLHFNQARGFEIVLRLLKMYSPQELQAYGLTPETVSMKGVRPVSDPNIFSDAQRITQMQGALALAEKAPQLYNMPELHKNMLSLMKINNYERFLIPQPQPQPMDPAAELIAFQTGQPVAVVPQQDHVSHLMVHINYLKDPLLGKNPIMVMLTSKILDHTREHLVHFTASRLNNMQQEQRVMQSLQQRGVPPQQMQQAMMQYKEKNAAQASQQVLMEDMQFAQDAMSAIAEADQMVKDHMRSQDPNMLAIQEQSKNQRLEIERKISSDTANQELDKIREKNLRILEMLKMQDERRDTNFKHQMELLNSAHEKQMDKLTQQVELMKNSEDNRQHNITELLKNRDDNRTAVIIAKIKEIVGTLKPTEGEAPPELNKVLSQIGNIYDLETGRDNEYIEGLQTSIQKIFETNDNTSSRINNLEDALIELNTKINKPRVHQLILDDQGEPIGSRSYFEEDE